MLDLAELDVLNHWGSVIRYSRVHSEHGSTFRVHFKYRV